MINQLNNKNTVMDYKESSIKVFFSSDYGLFKIINGNRQIDEGRVNRIKEDIQDGVDILKYAPILVYEKDGRLLVHDGQHRFYCAKLLKRPVHFIVMTEPKSLQDIAKINSNTSRWKTKDFLRCYIAQDNNHYAELEEFMVTYDLSISLAVRLLTTGDPGSAGGGNLYDFQQGLFEVKTKEQAVVLTEACRLFSDFKHWRSNYFFSAIKRIMDAKKVDIEDLAEKFHQNKELLIKMPDTKSYVGLLQIIFNKNKQKHFELI